MFVFVCINLLKYVHRCWFKCQARSQPILLCIRTYKRMYYVCMQVFLKVVWNSLGGWLSLYAEHTNSPSFATCHHSLFLSCATVGIFNWFCCPFHLITACLSCVLLFCLQTFLVAAVVALARFVYLDLLCLHSKLSSVVQASNRTTNQAQLTTQKPT